MTKVCHKMIAATAKAITAEVWEVCSSADRFHAQWPKQRPFVARFWKDFIGAARISLAQLLTQPDHICSEFMKGEIYEALVLEGGFKEVPMQAVPGVDGYVPSASEIARYGGLN